MRSKLPDAGRLRRTSDSTRKVVAAFLLVCVVVGGAVSIGFLASGHGEDELTEEEPMPGDGGQAHTGSNSEEHSDESTDDAHFDVKSSDDAYAIELFAVEPPGDEPFSVGSSLIDAFKTHGDAASNGEAEDGETSDDDDSDDGSTGDDSSDESTGEDGPSDDEPSDDEPSDGDAPDDEPPDDDDSTAAADAGGQGSFEVRDEDDEE